MNSIEKIKNEKLCINCGMCKSICPKNAIVYKRNESGIYEPIIEKEKCINCGICYKICPSNVNYDIDANNKEEAIKKLLIGDIIDVLICASRNNDILNNSTSGGFITTSIKYLLDNNLYDCAFLVKKHNYDELVYAEKIDSSSQMELTSKSRYLTISHSKTIDYIMNNPNERVIIVATPCSIMAIKRIIAMKNLNEDNYLFIGLFCDKTMNYNVIEYFNNHPKVKKHISKFYFRTKDNNSWPGDVGIMYEDGTKLFLSKTERMKIKDYFCMERCLYCMDKLNRLSDISVGDNYTDKKIQSNGNNSIIIRTIKGMEIWEKVKDLFISEQSSVDKIISSQKLNGKYSNLKNLKQKKSENIRCNNIENIIVTEEDIKHYNLLKDKINLGLKKDYKKIYKNTHSKFDTIKRKIKKILKK